VNPDLPNTFGITAWALWFEYCHPAIVSATGGCGTFALLGLGIPSSQNIFDFFCIWDLFVAQGVWNNWIVVQNMSHPSPETVP
jgi:hypothetical protein